MRLLDRVIEYRMPLFTESLEFHESRRLAWLYRIDLVRGWGRLSEALAWTCLECELNPQNVTAQVLKENLKSALDLQGQCSPKRFKLPVTVGRNTIEHGLIESHIISVA